MLHKWLLTLAASLFFLPASAQEAIPTETGWLLNPSFEVLSDDEARESCFDNELKKQWTPAAGHKIFWTVLIQSEGSTTFDAVLYSFCFRNPDRPGTCMGSYSVVMKTSKPKGWSLDLERSTPQQFFVKAANVARFADILDQTQTKVGQFDLFACRGFLGIRN